MEPVYKGMPPTDRTFDVGKWGSIRCGGRCKDDYARIVIHRQGDATHYVKLQRAAVESLSAVERILDDKGFHQHPYVYVTGHGWRACSDQDALYRSDSKRFADPDVTAHTRGLAIDVDMNQDTDKLKVIHRELMARHWFQARADEPWHYSFGIQV